MSENPAYAELQVTSNFSFLRGASHPEELARQAGALGHQAIAVTDRNSLAGVVRAHLAAKEVGIRPVIGARLDFTDAPSVLCLPTDRAAYGLLSRLLTLGKHRAPKGECHIGLADLFNHGGDDSSGQIIIALAPEGAPDEIFAAAADADHLFSRHLATLKDHFGKRCYLAAHHLYRGDDTRRLAALHRLSRRHDIPMVATNDVHMHSPERRPLADVLSAIRHHATVEAAGFRLDAHAERHLKSPAEMARLFRAYPDALRRTGEIADACRFSLDELRYEYPNEAPEGENAQTALVRLTWEGAAARYPDGVPERVTGALHHELALIEQLGYAPYFLTVHDIVRYARSQDILCQGRGSAANSAVCYCLGITSVDPAHMDLLFERFISAERDEPPDIDVDFEHERREEVIQYIYRKYGRERAGLAATLITYRSRSAIRDVGKAMGLSEDVIGALAGTIWGWHSKGLSPAHLTEIGLDPADPRLALAVRLARELIGFPRHLSQHVGGFVITRGPLAELSPIANAAMEDRTTLEWDKDDLDALGILKIDVLGLGMLSCIRKAFTLLTNHHDRPLSLATVPADDPATYDMLCKADSIGVFQVESRAQMTMLPRLKPRNFYDLVIEVAIVRPGPIQGDMVHPYLRRRNGEEEVSFPSKELERVLGKTKGIPLFQEQAMQIAIVAAGFTPSEADRLRRAMATFRRSGTINQFETKMINGMLERGYERDFAERCFRQIEGFGDYGFPESHAASFALLVYVSSWLKCHYPAAFACALLNSQPMGFYAPAQIVADARNHDVKVRPVDINHSSWDSTLENSAQNAGNIALRLGFRQIKGFPENAAAAITTAREMDGPFADPAGIRRRARLDLKALEQLARADGFGSCGLSRRQALWSIKALGTNPLPLFAAAGLNAMGLNDAPLVGGADSNGVREPEMHLPDMAPGEEVSHDYAALRLSLKQHPLALLRDVLTQEEVVPTSDLGRMKDGSRVAVAGLAITRQRPGTASGVIFLTLEDETGVGNLVIWPNVFERHRREVMGGRLIRVDGKLQREGIVIHVIADRLTDLTDRLWGLAGPEADLGVEPAMRHTRARHSKRLYPSRDFH